MDIPGVGGSSDLSAGDGGGKDEKLTSVKKTHAVASKAIRAGNSGSAPYIVLRRVSPVSIESASRNDIGSDRGISERAISDSSSSIYVSQMKVMQEHPILGPMCDGLVEKEHERSPLLPEVEMNPKVYVLAAKRALQYEAKAAGRDISALSLDSVESIDEALKAIQEGQDEALVAFLPIIKSRNPDVSIPDFDLSSVSETAEAIRDWMKNNQQALDSITQITTVAPGLKAIPPEIERLRNLKQLTINGSSISAIPEVIGKLSNLTHIRMGNNRLDSLPASLSRLENLQILQLSGNRFSAVPPVIFKLTQLTDLALYDNQIVSFPEELTRLSNLKYLNVSKNAIRTIPASIGEMSALRGLHLSDNPIENLPESIGRLDQLISLSLAGNQLSQMPVWMSGLHRLKYFDVSNNQIRSLPSNMDNFAELEYCVMSQNAIQELPDSIVGMGKLEYLALDSNKISTLPDQIEFLTSLGRLDLQNNKVTTVPDFLGRMKNLRLVDLSKNDIHSRSDWIWRNEDGNVRIGNVVVLMEGNPISDKDIGDIKGVASALLDQAQIEISDAIDNEEKMTHVARTYMRYIGEMEATLSRESFTSAEEGAIHEILTQIRNVVENGLGISEDALLETTPGTSSPLSGAAATEAEPPIETAIDREGVIFAQFSQSYFSEIKGWGGPCTYCSLEFIAESFLSPEDKTKFKIPLVEDPSDEVGQVTMRGAQIYMDQGNTGTVAFAEAYLMFESILEVVSETQIKPRQVVTDAEEATEFGIRISDAPWEDAVNALDVVGDNVGATITVAGSRFHTYGLIKKEGRFTFYDSHGEIGLGATSVGGDSSPPAYTKTFDSKEALIAYLNEIRQVAEDRMVFVEGIDVNVVRLKRA